MCSTVFSVQFVLERRSVSADRQLWDCGEARFTALGGNSRPRQPPIPFPDHRNPELPGTTDTVIELLAAQSGDGSPSVQSAGRPLSE